VFRARTKQEQNDREGFLPDEVAYPNRRDGSGPASGGLRARAGRSPRSAQPSGGS
jgi:hypothetical protein